VTRDFRASLPPKLSQTRATSGASVGHTRAAITREGMHAQNTAPAVKNVQQQPPPIKEPDFRNPQSGMNPDIVSADTGTDAQDRQTEQDPLAHETQPAETIPTTATPPEAGTTEPTIEGVENSPTGSVSEARYPTLIEESHPVGFPGKAAR
jgi:hypothetical protein